MNETEQAPARHALSAKARVEPGQVRVLPIYAIRPSPENDRLYRPVDPADPEIVTLVNSIRASGVQEPLIVTADYFIISGHRRHVAARLAGLTALLCVVKNNNKDSDHDEFMRLLVECNRQRVKSADEKLCEEVLAANPDVAYAALLEHRRQQSAVGTNALDMGERRTRNTISAAKWPMLEAIRRVLEAQRRFWPLSDRMIHYRLLNDPPLRHASKPKSRYRLDGKSYHDLCDLLTRARLTGAIEMEAIHDPTRPVTVWSVWREVGGFIRAALDGLFDGYWRDLQQSQPNHIEILCEKNTVEPILRPIASNYCIPLTSGRGYCSLPPRYEMVQRFRKSGKSKLIVLLVSDHDPDGMTIAESFGRSLRDDLGVEEDHLHPVKVALTADQVREFNLPPGGRATDKHSSNREEFIARYGVNTFELEALEPADLQGLLTKAIEAVIDRPLLNEEIEQEKLDASTLTGYRARVLKALGKMGQGGGGR